MNWTLIIDLAMEIAKNAPELIADVEKLWTDAQASVPPGTAPPTAAHQTAMKAVIQQAKAKESTAAKANTAAQEASQGDPAQPAPKTPEPSPKIPQGEETKVGTDEVAAVDPNTSQRTT